MKPWTATNSEGRAAPVALAVDLVVLTVLDGALKVCALADGDGGGRRLPGAFVTPRESPADACVRVLGEKAGLPGLYLEQLGAFAEPGRDPRGWIPTIAHVALVPPSTTLLDGARWVAAHGRHRWAYDHREILRAAVDRVEGKLWWSNVAVGILAAPFTLSEARGVYEAIARTTYDGATFARDLKATGLVSPTGESRQDGPGRPAALYAFTESTPAWGAGRRKRVAS